MRALALTLFLVFTAACCVTPIKDPDFTTPENTLFTFHDAFSRGDVMEREYECFSRIFKKNNGNMDYRSYYEFRHILAEEHPVAMFLFSLEDLSDNIIENKRISEDEAELRIAVKGEEITLAFVRETIYRLEFDRGRAEEDFLPPLQEIIVEGERVFTLDVPLSRKTRKRLHTLRRVNIEKQWKFLDFSFLNKNPGSVR